MECLCAQPAPTYSDATYTSGQFPLSQTNALNQTSTTAWNYDFGVPSSATDANGISTSWQYDAFGRKTRQNHPDTTYTAWGYVNCADVSWCPYFGKTFAGATIFDSANARVTGTHTTLLDIFDRPVFKVLPAIGNSDNTTTAVVIEYDSLGRVARESIPRMSKSATIFWNTHAYDLLGRPSSVTRPVSETDPTPQTEAIYHEGLTTRIVDAQGKQVGRVLNAIGQLARSSDNDAYYQVFDYDALGNTKRVQDSAGNTLQSSNYNLRGMLTARTDMDMGAWGFALNALGETVSQTDAKGQPTTFEFDLLGRLKRRIEVEGTSEWTWGSSSAAKNIGQLQSVSGPGYSETFTYDSLGRPSATTISADTTYQFDYTYNAKGQLQTIAYPTSTNGCRLTIQRNYSFEFLKSISNVSNPTQCGGTGEVFWTANEGNGFDQIIRETLGNGLVTNRAHDLVTGRLKSIQTGAGGGTAVQHLGYEWDLVGNLKKRKDLNQSNLTEEFFYDNLNRVDYSTLNGVTNLDMTYDPLGNITSKSDVGTYSYHATKKHQVTSTSNGWSFGYDSNGNMTSGRGATTTWTSFNYPASISNGTDSSSFSYTPDRQYWRQISNYTSGGTATTIYVGGILEKVTTSAGTDYRHMIRAGGATIIVSRQTPGTNSTHYVTQDHLGSNSVVTNGWGGVLVNASFDAYGKRRGSNWAGSPSSGDWTAIAATTRRGYTDHSMLDNLGLIHMNGRIHDPVLGRFISADSYITYPGMTQSYNRYSYVQNNSLSRIDPSGFQDADSTFTTVNEDREIDAYSSMMMMARMFEGASRDLSSTNYTTGLQFALGQLSAFRGVNAAFAMPSISESTLSTSGSVTQECLVPGTCLPPDEPKFVESTHMASLRTGCSSIPSGCVEMGLLTRLSAERTQRETRLVAGAISDVYIGATGDMNTTVGVDFDVGDYMRRSGISLGANLNMKLAMFVDFRGTYQDWEQKVSREIIPMSCSIPACDGHLAYPDRVKLHHWGWYKVGAEYTEYSTIQVSAEYQVGAPLSVGETKARFP